MKKSTAYGRKLKRTGGFFNGAAWAQTIQLCRKYGNDIPMEIPELISGTQSVAVSNMLIARGAYDELKAGRVESDNKAAFNEISFALSVACIRAAEIGGRVVAANKMLVILVDGNIALRRCLNRHKQWNKWQLDKKGVIELNDAIGVYETILNESSPAQMLEAEKIHREWVESLGLESVN